MPTVTAVSPVAGPVGGGGTAPVTRQTGAFPVNGESSGDSSITIAPVAVGDLVVLAMQLHSSGVTVIGVSGGNVGAWQRAVSYTNTTTDTLHYEVWWAVASAVGPSAVNLTYSAPVTQLGIELVADSFTTGSDLPWTLVQSAGSSNPSSTAAAWPSLTSGNAADELYWGASEEESGGTSTPTPGFTSNLSANANCFLFDGGLAPSTAYAPTCGEYPGDVSTAVGTIFAAGGPGGTAGTTVTVSGSNFAAGDTVQFGSTPATSTTVTSSSSITVVAPPGDPTKVGGTVDVTVSGPGGSSATSPADEFTYRVTNATYAISLTASSTSPATGVPVTLTATANRDIGPTPYGMSIVDASTGTIISHAGSGSSFGVDVSQSSPMVQRYVAEVDNSGGTNIQANSPPVIVTWSGTPPPPPPPSPTVSGVSPPSGPAAGGTTVTVTGTGFAAGDTVAFGSTGATSVSVASPSSLSAVAPVGTGTVDVTVTGPGGTSTTGTADRFTYTSPVGGSAGTYTEASGFPIYARGTGRSTIAVTPAAVGDLVVLFIELHSGTSPTVTGLTSSNIAWRASAAAVDDDPAVPLHVEAWAGVATSTSTATTTITFSGSVSTNSMELVGDSVHFSGSGTWQPVQGGGANGSSGTVAFPSLAAATGSSGGVYVGYSRVASSFAGGTTTGFSYYGTPMGNVELRGLSLAPATPVAPTASQSVSSEFTSIGAVFAVG
ncbi:MAG: IPT/TIG domain-containing protein [Acidimicrobiales bacterium]